MSNYLRPTGLSTFYLQPGSSGKPGRRALRHSLLLLGLGGSLLGGCQSAPQATAGSTALTQSQGASSPAAFAAQFGQQEQQQLGALWRCLFGAEGNVTGHGPKQAVQLALQGQLEADPTGYPGKVKSECVPLGRQAADALGSLTPPPAQVAAVTEYRTALGELTTSLEQWADRAPKWARLRQQRNTVTQAGTVWAESPQAPQTLPQVWLYDRYMRCAVPELTQMKDGQALLEHLATLCMASKDSSQPVQAAFLERLGSTCLPAVETPPTQPAPQLMALRNKLAVDHERLSQAWDACGKKATHASQGETPDHVYRSWTRWKLTSLVLQGK